MVDKLDLRIPNEVEFRPQFGEMFREIRNSKDNPFHETPHYQCVADLREYGHNVVLHMWNKHQKKADHKIEIIETAKMTASELIYEPNHIFDIPKRHQDLGIIRIDLAADVPHVPVSWFKNRVRVQYKQWVKEVGQDDFSQEYSEEGKRWVQTLYFGKKPNQLRVYDKAQHYRVKYGYLLKNVSDDAEVPTFESVYGIPEKGYELTRVESQIGGGRIPDKIASISKLRDLENFNPFERFKVECKNPDSPLPQWYDFRDFRTYATGMYLRQMALAEADGMHRVFQFLNMVTDNAKKKMETTYAPFLPSGPRDESEGVTSKQLYDFYRQSVSRQMAA